MVQDMRNGNGVEMAVGEFRVLDLPVSVSPSELERIYSAYGTSSKTNRSDSLGKFGW